MEEEGTLTATVTFSPETSARLRKYLASPSEYAVAETQEKRLSDVVEVAVADHFSRLDIPPAPWAGFSG